MEQGEVGRSLHGFGIDVFLFDMLFVGVHYVVHAVFNGLHTQVGRLSNSVDLCLKLHLQQSQLLDFGAFVASADLISCRHVGIAGFHADLLCAVDGDVHNLPAYAKTVELGSLGCFSVEREGSIFAQTRRIDGHGTVQAHVVEVEHGVFCLADVSADAELLACASPQT